MSKRIVWLILSCLMVVALVLSSCTAAPEVGEGQTIKGEVKEKPAPVEEEPTPSEGKPAAQQPASPRKEAEMVKVKLTKLDGTVVEKELEKPRYGGVFTGVWNEAPIYWDEAFGDASKAWGMALTNEFLCMGDWTRGPVGTGEASWRDANWMAPAGLLVGSLAESWELTDPQTLVYHIRKGVRFHNKPPTSGREMTADDVAFSLKRLWTTPTSYHSGAYPWEKHFQELEGGPWIEARDKYTVVVKTLPGKMGPIYEYCSSFGFVVPRDMVEKYGDLKDWKNNCGTGAFILIDYVPGSSITYERNPDYWGRDPFFPENRLPYLDGVEILIIKDVSTRLAALRTGKVDVLRNVNWQDGEALQKSNLELMQVRDLASGTVSLFMRVDRPESPLYDKRVRRALAMAVNQQEIAETYYGGNAELIKWPVGPVPEYMDVYIPLDELPESVRELFEYHPQKAKQLLAEAGYPEGFKTEIITPSFPEWTQPLLIVKEYFADIGVDMDVQVKEWGTFVSLAFRKKHEEMAAYTAGHLFPFKFIHTIPGAPCNFGNIDDPRINELIEATEENQFDEAKRRQLLKEAIPYMLDQAYILQLPCPYVYTFWWPWVKSYHGEFSLGKKTYRKFLNYIWLDLDLKEEMAK